MLLDVPVIVSSADIRKGTKVATEKKFENLKTITVPVVVNWLGLNLGWKSEGFKCLEN